MTSLTRALGALTASAVLTTGLVAGTTASSGAAETTPPGAGSAIIPGLPLPLPGLPGIPLDLPVLQTIPSLTGTANPGVGNQLGITPIVWTLLGVVTNLVSTDVVWTRNGLPIPGTEGLLSYVPVPADAGSTISAVLTGSLLGSVLSSIPLVGVLVPLLGGTEGGLSATNLPQISGEPQVGQTLAARAPTWNNPAATTTFQWLREGSAIPGATSPTYLVAAADEGKMLAVRALGTAGADTAQADSSAVSVLLEQLLSLLTAPSITGIPQVGNVLGSNPGTWSSVLTPLFGYQWLRDGIPISGATDSTIPLGLADAGRELALQVSASLVGLLPGLAQTSPVQVPKAPSATRATLTKKKIKTKQRGLMRVVLSPVAGQPSGQVGIYDKLKPVTTHTLRPSDNGRATFKLPRLKKGKHQLRAVFFGNDTFEPSVSKKAVLKVKKGKKRKNR